MWAESGKHFKTKGRKKCLKYFGARNCQCVVCGVVFFSTFKDQGKHSTIEAGLHDKINKTFKI